jgi:HEAT repeat protein
MTRPGIAVGAVFDPAETLCAYPELIRWIWGAKQMRALGRRGPGIVPKRFKVLLHDEQDRYSWWPSFRTWVERASAGDIVAAYEVCRNPELRGWLCYRVGKRELHAALPMLVHALNDPVPQVRSEAADALGRIGDPSTGHDLFKRYAIEEDPAVRSWLAESLGYTGYRPALPVLIDALAETDQWQLRAFAARALGLLGDRSALPALRQALAQEADDYAKERMSWAIKELESG